LGSPALADGNEGEGEKKDERERERDGQHGKRDESHLSNELVVAGKG
jgi:hypothetical protein